jgi:hypothetical protein
MKDYVPEPSWSGGEIHKIGDCWFEFWFINCCVDLTEVIEDLFFLLCLVNENRAALSECN